jgi:nitroreductase
LATTASFGPFDFIGGLIGRRISPLTVARFAHGGSSRGPHRTPGCGRGQPGGERGLVVLAGVVVAGIALPDLAHAPVSLWRSSRSRRPCFCSSPSSEAALVVWRLALVRTIRIQEVEVRPFDLETVDRLLTTTRSVRKRLDLTRPVAPEVVEQCLGLALQAPNAENSQTWHWVVVTDQSKRNALAELYRRSLEPYFEARGGTENSDAAQRLLDSVHWLAEHLHEVPVHVVPCIAGRSMLDSSNHSGSSFYGSILPAVWSFQLALHSRGVGSAWTTSHLAFEAEAADLLGIPSSVAQVALLPVAWVLGDDLRPALRRPLADCLSWEHWGERP